ncbi:hypothetical protein JW823_10145 [bacterium]|nr:hypothetical protein [candidate division CSSED10-310 bacterium]
MQGYLFPLHRPSNPDPYRILIDHLIPGAKRSIFIIDPSPADDIVHALSRRSADTISRRILIRKDLLNLGDSVPPDIMKTDSRHLIQTARVDVRAVQNLSARIAIIDDNALIVSGQYGSDLSWGIELDPTDAQPVVDYWNQIFHDATRVTDSQALDLWDRYQEKFWSGSVHPRDIVALYNNRGAFVEIQVRVFSGYRQLTLYPFSASDRDGPRGPVARWKLVDSRHFQILGRQASKIHGLKSLGIVRDTPAGYYLLRSDAQTWDNLFREREQDFRDFVTSYLDDQYETIRNEAIDNLSEQYMLIFREMKKNKQLLPMLDSDFVKDEVQEIVRKEYPDKQTLIFACQARYILYGLHPESAADRKLMESLSASAVANVLL